MIYINNKLVPLTKAVISVYDHGFLYGDGIYETLRVYKGIAFKIDEHIERLFYSASMIGLIISKTQEEIKTAVYKTVYANKHEDAVVRITVSRGAGPLGLDPDLCPVPTFIIMSHEFKPYPLQYYKRGVTIAIVNTRRNYAKAIDPRIKSLNFLNNILAKREAKDRNAYEAVMLNYRGYLTEGTVSNIFFLKDNVLCTPGMSAGILGGITRRIILNMAEELRIEVRDGNFKAEDIHNAREVFISNTTMEVMPVEKVDNVKIIKTPGEITRKLSLKFKKEIAAYIKGKSE